MAAGSCLQSAPSAGGGWRWNRTPSKSLVCITPDCPLHLLELPLRYESAEQVCPKRGRLGICGRAVLVGARTQGTKRATCFWKQVGLHFERKRHGEIAEEGGGFGPRAQLRRSLARFLASSATAWPRRPTRAADSALWLRVGLRGAVRRIARRLLPRAQDSNCFRLYRH